MTDKEIWESSELFKCYPLDDFTKYDKKMIKLTKKRREMVQQQHRDFEQMLPTFGLSTEPEDQSRRAFLAQTCCQYSIQRRRGKWYSQLDDAGRVMGTKSEYMEFKQKTFAKHVLQEKSKQRAAPYWQVKCKKICQKLREEQAEELKHDWIQRMSQWKLSEDD